MCTKVSVVASMMIAYNQLKHYKFVWIGRLSTVPKRFHRKYRRCHVVSFIGGSLAERNLEMFAAIVKLVVLFYAILAFVHFAHNPTLLASRDGLQTDVMEKMIKRSKYITW